MEAKEPVVANFKIDNESDNNFELTITYHSLNQVLFIIKDITMQSDFEKRLLNLSQREKEASKAKTDFLANMSHEIRTPMNAIIGVADLLMETKLDEEQYRYVETFIIASNTLLQIVNDVLDLSKIEAGQLDIEQINTNVDQVLKDIQAIMMIKIREKKLLVSFEAGPDIPDSFETDPTRLKQILFNLMSNAFKFTEHGYVKLHVKNIGHKILEFIVEDTGIGIPSDKVDKVFDNFTQADASTTRKYGGTGLGLTICKKLANMMGGDISVISDINKGSTFTLSLPLVNPQNYKIDSKESINNVKTTLDKSNFKKSHVLIVDDAEVNADLLGLFLTKAGHSYQVAENGVIAVEKFTQQDFDIVFMDMQMPVLDGFEATKKIREFEKNRKSKKVPIVGLTGNILKEDSKRSIECGCDEVLIRPINKKQFLATIKKYQ